MTLARIFWPSDYSGMIVHHMHAHPELAQGRRVCDIGTGSGVLAATALHLGAVEVLRICLIRFKILHMALDRRAATLAETAV